MLLTLVAITTSCERDQHKAAGRALVELPTPAVESGFDGRLPGVAAAPGDVGPRIDFGTIGNLPAEGLAIETDGVVVLVALDGRVLGHAPGRIASNAPPGPLLIDAAGSGLLVLDPAATRFIPAARAPERHVPLAHRAAIVVATEDGATGSSFLEREGHPVFELGDGRPIEFTVSNDRDIVSAGGQAFDVGADASDGAARTTLPPGCVVGDRVGPRWYLVCSEGQAAIAAWEQGGKLTQILGRLVGADRWHSVAVSPDGRRLLAQWSVGCPGQSVHLANVDGNKWTPLWEGAAAKGWTRGGQAIVVVADDPRCRGNEPNAAGVYLVAPTAERTFLYPLLPGVTADQVQVWAPLPG